MLVSELTDALKGMPQNANILGIFVQRQGELSEKRVQAYKVRIVSQTIEGIKYTSQLEYDSFVPEKKEEKPLTQKPFAGLKKMFTTN